MKTLHVAPGDSAGGSMLQAIRNAGRADEVLRFRDDLSCGPIDMDDPTARAAWWSRFYDDDDGMFMAYDASFWSRAATTDERLVIWFGRHSASELAFFLAMADRLGDRPYDIVDVTTLKFAYTRRDGTSTVAQPGRVGIVSPDRLGALLGSERPITPQERTDARQRWQRLRTENAPFRIVTPAGLVSAPADQFDPLLIKHTTREWQRLIRIIGDTMGLNSEPYDQVGDVMLLARAVALIGEGKLLAEGDPWDMRTCRVRLPD